MYIIMTKRNATPTSCSSTQFIVTSINKSYIQYKKYYAQCISGWLWIATSYMLEKGIYTVMTIRVQSNMRRKRVLRNVSIFYSIVIYLRNFQVLFTNNTSYWMNLYKSCNTTAYSV